jgi:hypothetical protein
MNARNRNRASQAFDQSVAVFWDGLFLAKGRMYTQAFFDVDQIEFTKGTENSVLGKNTSVGAISLVSREPGSPRWNGSTQMDLRHTLSEKLDWSSILHVHYRSIMFDQRASSIERIRSPPSTSVSR